jgi:hypothetical protein
MTSLVIIILFLGYATLQGSSLFSKWIRLVKHPQQVYLPGVFSLMTFPMEWSSNQSRFLEEKKRRLHCVTFWPLA